MSSLKHYPSHTAYYGTPAGGTANAIAPKQYPTQQPVDLQYAPAGLQPPAVRMKIPADFQDLVDMHSDYLLPGTWVYTGREPWGQFLKKIISLLVILSMEKTGCQDDEWT